MTVPSGPGRTAYLSMTVSWLADDPWCK